MSLVYQTIDNFINNKDIHSGTTGDIMAKEKKSFFHKDAEEIVDYVVQHENFIEDILLKYKGKKSKEVLNDLAEDLHGKALDHFIKVYLKGQSIDDKKAREMASQYVPSVLDIKKHFKQYDKIGKDARDGYMDMHSKHLGEHMSQPLIAKVQKLDNVDKGKEITTELYKVGLGKEDDEIKHVLKDAKSMDDIIKAFAAGLGQYQQKLRQKYVTLGKKEDKKKKEEQEYQQQYKAA